MKNQKRDLKPHLSFIRIISINLFCCQVFILMSIWMNEKSSIKHYYLKKNNFISNLNLEDITDADYMHAKRVCKDFEIKI